MKAVYENSFCMDSTCMNYFEDMCMVAMNNKGTDIEPYQSEPRCSKECKEFTPGTFLAYEVEFEEGDFE